MNDTNLLNTRQEIEELKVIMNAHFEGLEKISEKYLFRLVGLMLPLMISPDCPVRTMDTTISPFSKPIFLKIGFFLV